MGPGVNSTKTVGTDTLSALDKLRGAWNVVQLFGVVPSRRDRPQRDSERQQPQLRKWTEQRFQCFCQVVGMMWGETELSQLTEVTSGLEPIKNQSKVVQRRSTRI